MTGKGESCGPQEQCCSKDSPSAAAREGALWEEARMQRIEERGGKGVELELRGRRETQGSGDEAQGQETGVVAHMGSLENIGNTGTAPFSKSHSFLSIS